MLWGIFSIFTTYPFHAKDIKKYKYSMLPMNFNGKKGGKLKQYFDHRPRKLSPENKDDYKTVYIHTCVESD